VHQIVAPEVVNLAMGNKFESSISFHCTIEDGMHKNIYKPHEHDKANLADLHKSSTSKPPTNRNETLAPNETNSPQWVLTIDLGGARIKEGDARSCPLADTSFHSRPNWAEQARPHDVRARHQNAEIRRPRMRIRPSPMWIRPSSARI
jgi:hypothetical protein